MTILTSIKKEKTTYIQIQCDNCNKIFERGTAKHCKPKFDYKMLKNNFHYCSSECIYLHRNKMSGSFKLSHKNISIKCDSCGNEFKKWSSTIKNNKHNFCSKKCYGDAISNNIIPMNIIMSDEIKEKISASNKGKQPRLGAILSIGSRQKISQKAITRLSDPTKNPMFGKHHTDKAKQLMSEKHSELILNGGKRYGGHHIYGNFNSNKMGIEMFYRSSWELACMKWLETNKNVNNFFVEPFRIEYYIVEYNNFNQRRYYVPDFLIEFSAGRKELWEIKPKQFINNLRTQLKKEAAEKHCKENNIDIYKVLTKEDLILKGIL